MRIAFLTLGCKVNSYETEKMKMCFEEAGHRIVAFSEPADIYVVNTCTVTNIADRKSRKMLHRARRLNTDAIVVAAGCYVDSAQQRGEQDESIDLFLANADKDKIVEKVETLYREKYGISEEKLTEGTVSLAAREEEHTRAYVKVQEGCNQYCSYCIIPYVRGPLTSRPVEEVVSEVKELAGQGFREVVITGIHLSSYGVDGGDAKAFVERQGKPLLELLEKIHQIEGIKRIRLGSLEPRIITRSFVDALAALPKICPHFHLSLQSGCNATLQRMNRHYTTEEYLEKLALLRQVYQHPAITTDIIVGFPQETEEEFQTTCEFARKAAFSQIHVFKYSRRQGTVADRLEGQIEDMEKARRSDVLLQTASELEKMYQEYFLNQRAEILLEEISTIQGEDYLVGYTERYVRIAVPVQSDVVREEGPNTLASVLVVGHLTPGILRAEWC